MKLFSADQIRQWDASTTKNEPISSLQLMERAAKACYGWLEEMGFTEFPIKLFCGKGNNGGDGLVIARLLIENGKNPSIYILEFGHLGTPEFQENLHLLHQLTHNIHFIQAASFFPVIDGDDVVIDAIFGTGLNRALPPLTKEIIQHMNASAAKIIAIDVPSGMMIDQSCKQFPVIKANHTLSFESLKRCFFLTENAAFFGEISVIPIGLNPDYSKNIDVVYQMLTIASVQKLIKPRNAFSHKGSHGHALLIAGNKSKIGAAILASKACLRSGVGLLTVSVPESFIAVLHTALAETMVQSREIDINKLPNFQSICIGPGMGIEMADASLLHSVLSHYKNPMVIDADALTILSKNTNWLQLIPEGSILTPHPKEFERLFGICDNDYERADKAIALSLEYSFVIVLKGHYTLIASKGKGWYNITGNAGMAKGGTGDVLTGMLTALLAQQYVPEDAAKIGVFLHGLAADLALNAQSMESLLASDIIENIGHAFKEIGNQ